MTLAAQVGNVTKLMFSIVAAEVTTLHQIVDSLVKDAKSSSKVNARPVIAPMKQL